MNMRAMHISSATINTHDEWSCVSTKDFQIHLVQFNDMHGRTQEECF